MRSRRDGCIALIAAISRKTVERDTGAALPAETDDAYIRKVIAAGSFQNYERAHLNALAATFLPKLPGLPPEMVRRVVGYGFDVGGH